MVIELAVRKSVQSCPFCGNKPKRFFGVEDKKYRTWCDNSDCDIQPETVPHRINGLDIRAWNKRKFLNNKM